MDLKNYAEKVNEMLIAKERFERYAKMQNPILSMKHRRQFEKLEKQVKKMTNDVLNTQEKLF